MWLRLLGYFFCAVARLRPGEAGQDLDRVGAEFVRLDRRRPQHRATSR